MCLTIDNTNSILIGLAVACCDMYGKGTGVINIRNVGCSGTEGNITKCSSSNITAPLSHQYDVGVQCQKGWYTLVTVL